MGDQAIRSLLTSVSSGPPKIAGSCWIDSGELGSGPAMAVRKSARSCTVRAIGPETPSVNHAAVVDFDGTRPGVGRRPTTLQNDAGLRSEPPMSEPSASDVIPAASAAAAPPLDPPADLVRS